MENLNEDGDVLLRNGSTEKLSVVVEITDSLKDLCRYRAGYYPLYPDSPNDLLCVLINCCSDNHPHIPHDHIAPLKEAGLVSDNGFIPSSVVNVVQSAFFPDEEFEVTYCDPLKGTEKMPITPGDKRRAIAFARKKFDVLRSLEWDKMDFIKQILEFAELGFDVLDPEGKKSHEDMLKEAMGYRDQHYILCARAHFEALGKATPECANSSLKTLENCLNESKADFSALDPTGRSSSAEMKDQVQRRYVNAFWRPIKAAFIGKILDSLSLDKIETITSFAYERLNRDHIDLAVIDPSGSILTPEFMKKDVCEALVAQKQRINELLGEELGPHRRKSAIRSEFDTIQPL